MEYSEEVKTVENPVNPVKEDKTPGTIAYIFVIGWIIAYFMMSEKNSAKKTEFNLYHLRQALGVHIASVAISILGNFIPFVSFVGLIPLIFMIIGIVGASKGEMNPLPILGNSPQEWFKGIG